MTEWGGAGGGIAKCVPRVCADIFATVAIYSLPSHPQPALLSSCSLDKKLP
jgi:hypothetical protein